jgi:hypothetical protein
MSFVLSTAMDPGAASWVDVGSILVGQTSTTTLSADNDLTLGSGVNTFPRNLFTGEVATTLTVPTTGTWLVEITAAIVVTGGGGTLLQQSTFLGFTVNGLPSGDVAIARNTADATGLKSGTYFLSQALSLTAGDLVGASFGGGGLPAPNTMTAKKNRVLSITLLG